MAIFSALDTFIKPHNGRVPIVVCDTDKHDVYTHFLTYAPEGMSPGDARTAITAEFRVITAKNEEWNYDDIREALTTKGFERVDCTIWDEVVEG